MDIQKIRLRFKSWLATPLESDTVLWYVFAYDFDNLEDVFQDFVDWNPPFVISNGFVDWYLPKPFYFNNNFQREAANLSQQLALEQERKDKKSLSYFPAEKEIFKLLFEWNKDQMAEYDQKINQILENKNININTNTEAKNYVPRYHKADTQPYNLENIYYSSNDFSIYIKIFDDSKTQRFLESMKNVFESIGFGKYKSRGYWKISMFENSLIDENEKNLFDYLQELGEDKWIYYVLNNYKIHQQEIDSIDTAQSYLNIWTKNTKTTQDFVFKWNMSMVLPWSVIYADTKLTWDYYQTNKSFNFWYIF